MVKPSWKKGKPITVNLLPGRSATLMMVFDPAFPDEEPDLVGRIGVTIELKKNVLRVVDGPCKTCGHENVTYAIRRLQHHLGP